MRARVLIAALLAIARASELAGFEEAVDTAPSPPPKHVADDFTHGDPTWGLPPPSGDAPRPPYPPLSPFPPPYPPIVSVPCETRVNLTLILDASGSMQSSLEAVRQLSHNLVGLLDFSHSRAAVHGFHDSAHVIQEMTSVASDVEAAIDAHGTSAYPIGGGTNVDVAFSQMSPLAGSGSEIRIAVLISDGFFPTGSFVALTLANELKANGVLIYTLSLGAMVSSDFLHSLASAPSTHFAISGSPVELWAAMSQNLCAMCGPIEDAWEEGDCCEDETPLACQQLLVSAEHAHCDEC